VLYVRITASRKIRLPGSVLESSRWKLFASAEVTVSVGGALGGVFAGLVAPLIFNDYTELPLSFVLTTIVIGLLVHYSETFLGSGHARPIEVALLATILFGSAFLCLSEPPQGSAHCLLMKRNFYGAVRVYEYPETDQTEAMRELVHGNVNHGSEFMRASFHRYPTTYYGPTSGIGIALADRPGRRSVAIIGLGTGTLAAYARAGDRYRFYEVNPIVIEISKSYFFYLKECRAQWDVVLSDGRLALEQEAPDQFDVVALDAFSGDSPPVHLLTIEAFRQYFRVLKPNGVLAVHVSNNYVRLDKVVATVASTLKKGAVMITSVRDQSKGTLPSKWIVLATNPAAFERPEWKVTHRKPLSGGADSWTDDFSNVMDILK
jgi:SAM-dependent methyltransferase